MPERFEGTPEQSALCRSEVERAMAWYHERVLDRDPLLGFVDPTKQYCGLRFPEPPEPKECAGHVWFEDKPCTKCGKRPTSCTACSCARCQAEREFVRAMVEERVAYAKEVELNPSGCLGPSAQRLAAQASALAAARRVTEGR